MRANKFILVKDHEMKHINLETTIKQQPCATASASSSEVLWRLNSGLSSPAEELGCHIQPSGIVEDIHTGVSEDKLAPKSA